MKLVMTAVLSICVSVTSYVSASCVYCDCYNYGFAFLWNLNHIAEGDPDQCLLQSGGMAYAATFRLGNDLYVGKNGTVGMCASGGPTASAGVNSECVCECDEACYGEYSGFGTGEKNVENGNITGRYLCGGAS